jgi:hypothetical protein
LIADIALHSLARNVTRLSYAMFAALGILRRAFSFDPIKEQTSNLSSLVEMFLLRPSSAHAGSWRRALRRQRVNLAR